MTQTKKQILLILEFTCGVGLIMLNRQRDKEQGRLGPWQAVLARQYGAEKAQAVRLLKVRNCWMDCIEFEKPAGAEAI